MFIKSRIAMLALVLALTSVVFGTVMGQESPPAYLSADGYVTRDEVNLAEEGCAATAETIAGQAFSSQAFSSQAFSSQAFSSQAFSSQAFSAQAFSSQAFSSQAFSSQAFSSQAFSSQAFSSQALFFDSVPYDFDYGAVIQALAWVGQDFSFGGYNNPKATALLANLASNANYEPTLGELYSEFDFIDQLAENTVDINWADNEFSNLLGQIPEGGLDKTAVVILDEFDDDPSTLSHGDAVERVVDVLNGAGSEVSNDVLVRTIDVTAKPIDFIAQNIATAIDAEVDYLEALGYKHIVLNLSWAIIPCETTFSNGETFSFFDFIEERQERENIQESGDIVAVEPFATCGYEVDNNKYAIRFGYNNRNIDSVALTPNTESNQLIGNVIEGELPTLFESGIEAEAFAVTVRKGSLTWTLADGSSSPQSVAIIDVEDFVNDNACFEEVTQGRGNGNYCRNRDNRHPAGNRLAQEFGLDYSYVIGLHCDGIDGEGKVGWGDIRDFIIAEQEGIEQPVIPILECVTGDDGNYTAQFGYDNPNDYSVFLEDDDSTFSDGTPNPAEPNYLLSGRSYDVFTIAYSAEENSDGLLPAPQWTLSNTSEAVTSAEFAPFNCIADDGSYTIYDYFDDNGLTELEGLTELVGFFYTVEEILGETITVSDTDNLEPLISLLDGYADSYLDNLASADSEDPSAAVLTVAASGNYGPIVRLFTGSFDYEFSDGTTDNGSYADGTLIADDPTSPGSPPVITGFTANPVAEPLVPARWRSTMAVGTHLGNGPQTGTPTTIFDLPESYDFTLDDGSLFLFSQDADIVTRGAAYVFGDETIVGTSFAAPGVSYILSLYGGVPTAACETFPGGDVEDQYPPVDDPATDLSVAFPWANAVLQSGPALENPLRCNVAPNAEDDYVIAVENGESYSLADFDLLGNDNDPDGDDPLYIINSTIGDLGSEYSCEEDSEVDDSFIYFLSDGVSFEGVSEGAIPALTDRAFVDVNIIPELTVNQLELSAFRAGDGALDVNNTPVVDACGEGVLSYTSVDIADTPFVLNDDGTISLSDVFAFLEQPSEGGSYEFNLTVTDASDNSESILITIDVLPPSISIDSFSIINLDGGGVIDIDSLDPAVLDLAVYPNVTIQANVSGNVGSVRFDMDSFNNPIDLFDFDASDGFKVGDVSAVPFNTLTEEDFPFDYTIKATPFTDTGIDGVQGAEGMQAEFTFTVVDSGLESDPVEGDAMILSNESSCGEYLDNLNPPEGESLSGQSLVDIDFNGEGISPFSFLYFTSANYTTGGITIDVSATSLVDDSAVEAPSTEFVEVFVLEEGCSNITETASVSFEGNTVFIEPNVTGFVIVSVFYVSPSYNDPSVFTFTTSVDGKEIASVSEVVD